MKPGSKYYPLFEYLQRCDRASDDLSARKNKSEDAQITLTLNEVEQILQTALPPSARRRAWWSNRDSSSALQAAAWIQAGYHVDTIDFERQTVTFHKFKAEYTLQRKGDAIVWNQDAIRALRKHMGLTQAKFSQELGVRRQTVSEWENGVYEPDRSTAKHLELIAKQRGFE
ncbi:MAG: helix-turn-helix transcriptional regulator [Cyanobacteria bacterium P01_G01_bin.38]